MIELLLQADRLLNVDQVDQAQATYQRVADQDPQNAIAVVGLARCALAKGDDRRAYVLAAQALAIDPENDMARRMEARMAEVLSYRGEALPDTPRPAAPAASVPAATAAPAPAASSKAPPRTPAKRTSTTSPSRSWLDRLRGH